MTKQDFLEALSRTLNGKIESGAAEEHIRFYNSFFAGEMAKGRSEAEIAQSLGDPRILARTLIDAAERAGDASAQNAYTSGYSQGGYAQNGYTQNGYTQGGTYQRAGYQNNAYQNAEDGIFERADEYAEVSKPQIPGWLIALILIVVLLVVIRIIGSIFFALLPYLIPIVIIGYIVKLFRRN